jgi:hypothetical protein
MRRPIVIIVLLLATLACRLVSVPPPAPTPTPLPTATFTLQPQKTPAPFSALPPLPAQSFEVRFHPDGGLYSGDRISFEIIAPSGASLKGRTIVVEAPDSDGVDQTLLEPVEFSRFGIGGRTQATLFWAWDTAGLPSGSYEVTFTIQPDGQQWTETVSLLPEDDLPSPQSRWASTESDCCLVYYITGTEAERDLPALLDMADAQAAIVEDRLQADFTQTVTLVLLPRVLGHGGFTSDEIAVSYLDMRYTGGDPAIILRHELAHFLDNELGGMLRPTILVEGLAVYLSGGHFKEEALLPRAAALLELGWYQPLRDLASDFYPSQHEIGYLEAGALVEYMVDRWGWEAFSGFYRSMEPKPPAGDQVNALEAALLEHFGLTLAGLEADYLQELRAQTVLPEHIEDVRLTVEFYDTARRYQAAHDPSAYYLTAWLPDLERMRNEGILADLLRHPAAPENILVESLLVSADKYLRLGDYAVASALLETVNQMLDILTR